MSIDRLRAHYGFSRMPFGKDLAPGMLHAHGAHAEAVARIQWCIQEQAIGVISGECGAGKTVAARAAVAALDASRHTILYLGTPGVGLRGIYGLIIATLGGTPRLREGFVTDNGNVILDVAGMRIADPPALETAISLITGVVTVGLFARRAADVLLLGTPDGVQTIVSV